MLPLKQTWRGITGDCARPAGCAFPYALAGRGPKGISSLCSDIPNALAGRALAQDCSFSPSGEACCFMLPLKQAWRGITGIVLALRAAHSPTPSPGGPLHRIAASSASGKKTVFLPGCNQGIVLALRAVHSPTPSPGGPLHRIAALSIRRGLLFYAPAQASLAGHKNNNSLPQCGKLLSCAVKGGFEPPVRKPVRQFSKLLV